MYRKFGKRLMDFVLSLCALIVLSPVLLVTAVLVHFNMGSPVLFRQRRAGKDEVPFDIYKFRSMKNAFDEHGVALPDKDRITPLGKFLRKTSLDELPSLLNILKGEMSIVGPRPLPVNYLPWYTEEERVRHSVRGGLTGLAQINGRNAISWEDRFAYDLEYVNNITFLNDMKIILKTAAKVLKRSDVVLRGSAASPGDFHVLRSGKSEQELAAGNVRKEN